MLGHLSRRRRNALLLAYLVLGTIAWVPLGTWGLIGVGAGTVLVGTLLERRSDERKRGPSPRPLRSSSSARRR